MKQVHNSNFISEIERIKIFKVLGLDLATCLVHLKVQQLGKHRYWTTGRHDHSFFLTRTRVLVRVRVRVVLRLLDPPEDNVYDKK